MKETPQLHRAAHKDAVVDHPFKLNYCSTCRYHQCPISLSVLIVCRAPRCSLPIPKVLDSGHAQTSSTSSISDVASILSVDSFVSYLQSCFVVVPIL